MKGSTRVGPLLVVQARRVDQAMAGITVCNLRLREARLKCSQAHASRDEAQGRVREALDKRAQIVANGLGQPLSGADLLSAAQNVEWLRACAAQRAAELETARAAVFRAEQEADRARRAYREAHARLEALLKLAEDERKVQLRKELRAQERELDDCTSKDFAARLVDVA
jgi:flagellar biosynthesis chaperone FliJ